MDVNVNPNEKTSQSQNAKILAYLKKGGRITPLDAFYQFNCLRLSARIKDLRDRGHNIQGIYIKTPSGKNVKQYFLENSND